MSSKITVSEEIYTHVYLWNAHRRIRRIWENGDRQGGHEAVASLLLAYLAFEAFVNFCGEVVLPEIWAREREYFRGMKGSEIENKIAELANALPAFKWEKGKRPYQSVRALRDFRDSVAHGKLLRSQYLAEWSDDGSHLQWNFSWFDRIEDDVFDCSIGDIRAFSQSLLVEVRKQSDHPHLIYDAFEGEFARSTSG
jgi:hypothetical protein